MKQVKIVNRETGVQLTHVEFVQMGWNKAEETYNRRYGGNTWNNLSYYMQLQEYTTVFEQLLDDWSFEVLVPIKSLSNYLQSIIQKAINSEENMWFVEFEDEEYLEEIKKDASFCENLKAEVINNNLQDYIICDEDDCYIEVYGEIITKLYID